MMAGNPEIYIIIIAIGIAALCLMLLIYFALGWWSDHRHRQPSAQTETYRGARDWDAAKEMDADSAHDWTEEPLHQRRRPVEKHNRWNHYNY